MDRFCTLVMSFMFIAIFGFVLYTSHAETMEFIVVSLKHLGIAALCLYVFIPLLKLFVYFSDREYDSRVRKKFAPKPSRHDGDHKNALSNR